ncbi:MAG: NAD(P)/FAD-dependent oxidoreductase [Thermodesulfovibrionales bacterium]
MKDKRSQILILGGGLTGLSAGYVLTRAGCRVKVFEGASTVGGLSKTIVKGGFRFDLGGHRFFTKNRKVEDFVKNLMGGELVSVSRKSKIYMRRRYFDYPLKPVNAIFGLGIPTTLKIISDYGSERLRGLIREPANISLEDWVVSNFGRRMFDIYFKEYSEKVWGIDCSRISAEWISQRIKGLSLPKAIKNAFLKFSEREIPTFADSFLYPRLGIGRISDRLREEIERENNVFTDMRVERINHSGSRIESIVVKNHYSDVIQGGEFVSSIPLPGLINMLCPSPPEEVLNAASRLRFRDLVVVAIMVNRKRVTDQTWIYIPEQDIPFGRIHEPTNWSEKMAPEGKTLMVMEFFSNRGDRIWNESDGRLTEITVKNLEALGFIKGHEVLDSAVVRVPCAYPLFEIGYKEACDVIYDYLCRFKNLHISGRGGMFRYYNMDHAIESGISAAEKVMKGNGSQIIATEVIEMAALDKIKEELIIQSC